MKVKNSMNETIERDARGNLAIVDESSDGTKAIPVVLVTKNASGEFEYTGASGGGSGQDGKSTYEISVENGFEGDESAWLESLKGADGAQGPKGADGTNGAKGETGEPGFGTEEQYNDLVARIEALESKGVE